MIEIKPKEPLENYLERKAADELESLAALIRDGKVRVITVRHTDFGEEFTFEVSFEAREWGDA